MSENNKESKLLKDAIKEVFEHELLEKEMSKDRFDEVIKDKNIFLGIFSPWHQAKGKELIQGFVNNVKDDNSTNDFSWLDILDDDKRWKEFPNDKLKKEIIETLETMSNFKYTSKEKIKETLETFKNFLLDDFNTLKETEDKEIARIKEENKKKISGISILSKPERIERIAVEELKMRKALSAEILRVSISKENKDG